jgi:hypothetical protein
LLERNGRVERTSLVENERELFRVGESSHIDKRMVVGS